MEVKDILEELSVFGEDLPVPKEALAEAVRQREEVVPVLLESLDTLYEKTLSEGEGICDDPAYGLASYAIFLLAEMREQRAFPKLLRLLTLERDDLDGALGDIIFYLGNCLYSTYNGDFAAAKEILGNSSLNPFSRGAVLNLLGGLFEDGRLSREELEELSRERLAGLGDDEDEATFGGLLVDMIADNDLYELVEDVRDAYDQEKIDIMHLGEFDGFFDFLYNESQDKENAQLVTDTAEELSDWACFKDDGSKKPSMFEILEWNVGRNEPCPCGSGKKFKKCCLPKKEEFQLKLDRDYGREINFDEYPPVERQGDRPGLLDFYSADAIEVDRLAYQALRILNKADRRRQKELVKIFIEARDLLWRAFEKYRQICEAEGLQTIDAYDRKHKLHYYAKEWLDVLSDMLEDMDEERYQAVRAVLEG